MRLGELIGGETLTYDTSLYEFRISNLIVSPETLRALDSAARIHWLSSEQRDWFLRVDPADFASNNKRALSRNKHASFEHDASLTAEQRIHNDAARDDSILEGHIVDADPALVQAVIEALEKQGFTSGGTGGGSVRVDLPQGMESLSQLQGQQGRKMTLLEHYLMRRILKNDDRDKIKRERRAESIRKSAEKDEKRESDKLEKHSKIAFHQKRSQKRDEKAASALRYRSEHTQVEKQDTVDENSLEYALGLAEKGARERMQAPGQSDIGRTSSQPSPLRPPQISADGISYTDSAGRPIRPEADAIRPSDGQYTYEVSEEEKALADMRARNLAEQSRYDMQPTDVPGMESAGGGRGASREGNRNSGASINGREVNADGTPKETNFDKFTSGLGKIASALSPLIGGGGRGGGGGGMGGGGAGGGMGGGAGMGGMGGMGMGGGM